MYLDKSELDTVVFKIILPPPCGFPMISIVNKSCNIECCVNNMFRINKKNDSFSRFRAYTKCVEKDLYIPYIYHVSLTTGPYIYMFLELSQHM